MTLPDVALAEQRRLLCRQLRTQRLDLAQNLGRTSSQNPDYPRSITMRLLLRRPVLVARVALGLLRFLRRT